MINFSVLRIAFLATVTLGLGACASNPSQLSQDDQLIELAEDSARKVPGVIIHVNRAGSTFSTAAGTRDIRTTFPMRAEATLRIGSITKTYMAAIAVLLSDQGKLNLDAPISRYLSQDVLQKLPDGLDPKIRSLLNHSSGIPDYYSARFYLTDWDRYKPLTPELTLHAIREIPAVSLKEGEHSYSNTNYQVLALVLESVTGESVDQLLRENIFGQMGLSQTYYHNQFPPGDEIHGYGSPIDPNEDTYDYWENSGPDGGMFASASDAAIWIRALFSPEGEFATVGQQMAADPLIERERKEQGMGVEILISRAGERVYGHTGGVDGYLTAAFYIPDSDTVLVVHMNKSDEVEFSRVLSSALKIVLNYPVEES